MPRFSSGSGSRSSSRPKTYSTQTSSKSVTPYHPPPVPAPYHPTAPTFLQSAKEGFGLGVGVSIARNIVDRAFGAAATAVTTATPTTPPINSQPPKVEFNTKLYEQCIENGATEDFCRQIAASNNIKLDSTTK